MDRYSAAEMTTREQIWCYVGGEVTRRQ